MVNPGLPYTATRGCDGLHTETALKKTILKEILRALTPTYKQPTVKCTVPPIEERKYCTAHSSLILYWCGLSVLLHLQYVACRCRRRLLLKEGACFGAQTRQID